MARRRHSHNKIILEAEAGIGGAQLSFEIKGVGRDAAAAVGCNEQLVQSALERLMCKISSR